MRTLVGPGLLLFLWQSIWALDVPLEKMPDLSLILSARQPPTIIKQSLQEHIVDPKETMVMECEAKGNPHPIFSWRRNGKYFNVARDSQVSMRRRSGTLDIYAKHNPEQYEAEYQCVASNLYGSAYTHKIRLRLYRPPVWPREILEPVIISAGLPLVLPCDAPPGPPKPETYWMSSSFPTMQAVRQDRRVSMGVNGDLYFSNVLVNDSTTDYCCSARFPYKNMIQQKMPVVVKVLTSESLNTRFKFSWESLQAGVPTPRITWTKDGEDLPVTSSMKVKNFNKMIQIPKASFEDAGEYMCAATNRIGYIEHTITVRVRAAPFWLERPTNLILAPEENGQLVCRSDGAPRPTISWSINGEPIETSTPQSNRQVSGETITFRSVSTENTAVYQCNASNEHGYLLANAFVNVLHATPRIIGPRNELIKTIEGHRAFLDCRFFGSPVPELYGQGNLEGNRFRIHRNGTLEIKRIQIEDQGTYLCVISNIAGRDENQVRVEVKEPIIIVTKPQSMKVLRGSDVRLECGVKPDTAASITTAWMKNKKQAALSWRVSMDGSNLVITNVNRGDEGNYTCVIQNDLEQKSASAHLMVMDRPSPPTDLELSDPYERSVRLSWVPGDSNHSPINVQYDDDDWIPGKWKNLSTYPGSLNSVMLHLSPFTYYEFRVIANNEIGSSRPSRPSKRFQTSAPDVIPKNLKGVGTWRNNMEISWEPLTWREWNGPHLKYLVWWRRRDSREEWKNATTKWLKYYIYDADTFTPYEIKVQAVNDFGLGPESPVVTGYSGEDRPIAAPLNLRVSDIESTQVTLHWDPVTRESIMGELKEYKVYYWRDSSQLRWHRVNRGMRSKVFPNSDPEPSGVVTDLIPYSNYKMYIVVTNSRYEGPPSNHIHFSTPEGVPSAPKSFRIQQRHLDSIYVDWDLPEEPNGVITGYSLKYQTGMPKDSNKRCQAHLEIRKNQLLSNSRKAGYGSLPLITIAVSSPHYTTEIYAQDQVDISTQGWFIGIMCAVALIVLILLIVCFIKRSRGGKYPGTNEGKSCEIFQYAEVHTGKTYSKPRAQPSVAAILKRSDSDDSLVEYGEGGEIQFNEDGSFIGQYTGTRRDVRDLDFGGNLELHSPMNTIYSLA
uniref:Neural cell adhesion molecule L1 n=1 Tax=Xiphophorus couchianus TaxID=32473 RepID=A0A3B5M482_9TELE